MKYIFKNPNALFMGIIIGVVMVILYILARSNGDISTFSVLFPALIPLFLSLYLLRKNVKKDCE